MTKAMDDVLKERARQEEIAWAAGLFEGEGCFSLANRSDRPNGKPQACALLRMTDEDIVRRFHVIVEVGSVSAHGPQWNGTKPFWQWSIRGHDSVRKIVRLFWPWLGKRRREKAEEVVLESGRPGTKQVQIRSRIIDEIILERLRQDDKFGEQNHDPFTYLTVLVEEVGEFAQAALHSRFGGPAAQKLREEAVHTAAVALAIVECIDRGKWTWPIVQENFFDAVRNDPTMSDEDKAYWLAMEPHNDPTHP